VLGLIDTRGQPPPGGDETREPWYMEVVGRLFPWPAIIVWLLVAYQVLDGWPGVIALWAGVILFSWRVLKLLPDGGMRDYRQ
jgi:hypothetical protein